MTTSWMKSRANGLGHSVGHDRPRDRQLVQVLFTERRQDCLQMILDLFGTEPRQGSDDLTGPAVRGRQLPARIMAQFDRQSAETQPPVAPRGQIDFANRVLVSLPKLYSPFLLK